jgi:hypothetical protein
VIPTRQPRYDDAGGCAGCDPAGPKKTCQGREGGAYPFCAETEPAPDRRSHFYLARGIEAGWLRPCEAFAQQGAVHESPVRRRRTRQTKMREKEKLAVAAQQPVPPLKYNFLPAND